MILALVRDINSDLGREPFVRRRHYKSWIKTEAIGPRVEDLRWSYALGPDGAVRDIEMAENLLATTLSLTRDLPELASEQSLIDLDTDVLEQMQQILRWIGETLTRGEYVTLGQFQAWDDCLRKCGVRRRTLTGISYIDRERERIGTNIDFIEQRPSGAAWDHIEKYDSLLVNIGGRDVSHQMRQ